jgi:hypothetical protein
LIWLAVPPVLLYAYFRIAHLIFEPTHVVIPWSDRPGDLKSRRGSVWVSIGPRDGQPTGELPVVLSNETLIREVVDFSSLRLMRLDF